MNTTQMAEKISGAYDRRIRELASDLADRVAAGEMTETEANETLARKQDEWSDSPWG
jgi:hypothetical protein